MNIARKIRIRDMTFNITSNSPDVNQMWSDISTGDWEPQTFRILDNILTRDDCALELGIDSGQTFLFTAAKVGKFIAVEPSITSIELAYHLLELNPELSTKTLVVHGALSNNREKILFGRGSEFFDEIHFTEENQNIYVDAFLIEDLEKIVGNPITFINMDIEGGEFICLSKMYTWLRVNKPILLLSLHPGFLLTPKQKEKVLFLRYLKRIYDQRIIFKSIWFYRYIYDAVTLKRIFPFSIFRLKYIRSKSAHNSQILCMKYRIKRNAT